jgi:hypothetical protein
MKSKGQGKKEFVVMQLDDYKNEWKVWSVPVTIKQADYQAKSVEHARLIYQEDQRQADRFDVTNKYDR